MKTILGVKGWDLSEYAISANAILGIRDSGKTYTGTEAAEELFDAGVPFVAFDPIGVWHSLRIPGQGKGYPVVVAGGRHADLPLTRKNAGDIVRAAMAAGVSLVIDLFSMEMSKADWRAIVRECVEILLHENVDHGLRHIFIEEAAEFVPQRPQDMLVYSAVEKLVRMGGNSKLGCTLINQRSADLNKSVLELCANVFVHRQKGKNTILDLKKWFTLLDLSDAEQDKIADSLPNLKSGECWALINDLPKPVFLKVPAKNSLHPDRRAVTVKGDVKRAPVPATAFVEQMKSKLAEKDKPKAPVPTASKPVEKIDTLDQKVWKQAAAAAEKAAAVAREEGAAAVRGQIPAMLDAQHKASFAAGLKMGAALTAQFAADAPMPGEDNYPARKPLQAITSALKTKVPPSTAPSLAVPPRPTITPSVKLKSRAPAEGLTGPQQRMLDTIAFWNATGDEAPTIEQVAAVCGYSFKASTRRVVAGALATAGLIHYPNPGQMALTADGQRIASAMSADEAGEKLKSVLSGPQTRIVDILREHGTPMGRDRLIEAAGYSPNASTHRVVIGALSTLKMIHYPEPRVVALSDWVREVLA